MAEAVHDCDAVLISDYAKGTVSSWLASEVIALCRNSNCPILVDPCRDSDWSAYRHASLISPNRRAVEFAVKQSLLNADDRMDAATVLRHRLDLQAAVITLDRNGIAFATDETAEIVPCRQREVCDVTGAGDMVLAILGFCATMGLSYRESLRMANAAAGLEVERFGVQVVTREEIAGELRRSNETKILTISELSNLCAKHRQARRKIVFTNGCFDLLHIGHMTLLREAAAMGDILIVAINSDASVRKLKGNERPVIGQDDRARMLSELTSVNHVVIFDEDTPCNLLELLRPDILVKGGSTDQIVGREIVERYGGRALRTANVPGTSTTNLVQRFRTPREDSATSLMVVRK